jgi:hypothetical protein
MTGTQLLPIGLVQQYEYKSLDFGSAKKEKNHD